MQVFLRLLSSCVLSIAWGLALLITGGALGAPSEGIRGFGRLVGGDWRLTLESDRGLFERWEWGPGERSLIQQTYGPGAQDEPWRSLLILYQRPGGEKVGLFGLTPDIPGLGTGVSRGEITIEGDAASGTYTLHQPGHPLLDFRDMGLRWDFRDDDTYHDTMLEDPDGAGLRKLAEWTRMRSREESDAPPVPLRDAAPSGALEAFTPFVGEWEGNNDGSLRTLVEWIPYVGAVRVRGVAQETEFEAFVYRVPGGDELRCFALVGDGRVYEGDVMIAQDGRVHAELANEGEDETRFVVEVGVEKGGELRQRVWRVGGEGRVLVVDGVRRKARLTSD